MIPWLIGAAVVGIAAAIASDDDSSSSGVANTIKRVVKTFWEAVKDAFYASILISPNTLAIRTYFDKTGYRPEHTNDEYFLDSNGKTKRRRKIIEEEDDIDLNSINDPELRAEIERRKAEITAQRQKMTNTI